VLACDVDEGHALAPYRVNAGGKIIRVVVRDAIAPPRHIPQRIRLPAGRINNRSHRLGEQSLCGLETSKIAHFAVHP